MSTNENISKAVRVLMSVHGETNNDLAKVLDVTPNRVSERLNGRSRWQIEDLDAIAAHYGVKPWNLMMGPKRALTALTNESAVFPGLGQVDLARVIA